MNRQPGGAGGGAEGQDEIQSHKKKARTFLTSFNSRTSALEGQLKLKKKKRKASAVQGVIKTNQVNQKQKFTLEALLCAKTRAATCIKDQLFSPPPRFLQMYMHDIYVQAHARKNTLSLSYRLRCKGETCTLSSIPLGKDCRQQFLFIRLPAI